MVSRGPTFLKSLLKPNQGRKSQRGPLASHARCHTTGSYSHGRFQSFLNQKTVVPISLNESTLLPSYEDLLDARHLNYKLFQRTKFDRERLKNLGFGGDARWH